MNNMVGIQMFVTITARKRTDAIANGQRSPDTRWDSPTAATDVHRFRTVGHCRDDLATAAEPACALNRDGDPFLDVTIGFPVRLCKRVPGQHGAVDCQYGV